MFSSHMLYNTQAQYYVITSVLHMGSPTMIDHKRVTAKTEAKTEAKAEKEAPLSRQLLQRANIAS